MTPEAQEAPRRRRNIAMLAALIALALLSYALAVARMARAMAAPG